jgi:SAM-dependent methyltransferase
MSERPLAEEWHAQADAWARFTRTPGHDHHFHIYNWPRFAELIPPPGEATLDLGCGEGRLGRELHTRGHRVTGVDYSPTLAELARETGAYEDVRIADAAALPFEPESFDLVVAFMSLQDMDDAAGAIHEARRVLKPQGRLLAAFVHPFASAHLGREPSEQRTYFDTQRTRDELQSDGLAFTFHQIHRPLHAWLGMFFAAGLQIDDLREPRPTAADVAAHPTLAKTHARPAFLHVSCVCR